MVYINVIIAHSKKKPKELPLCFNRLISKTVHKVILDAEIPKEKNIGWSEVPDPRKKILRSKVMNNSRMLYRMQKSRFILKLKSFY